MKRKVLLCMVVLFCCFASKAQSSLATWKITDLEKYIDSSSAQVLVINFWATFCKPCVAEIPYFIEVCNKYDKSKVRLLLVSLDLPSFYPNKIEKFVAKHSFIAPVVWLNESNADYFCPRVDSSWSGSIPATLIVHRATGKRFFWEEEISKSVLQKTMDELLAPEH